MSERRPREPDGREQRDHYVESPGSPEEPPVVGGGMHDDREETTGELLGEVLALADQATGYLTPDEVEDRLRRVLAAASTDDTEPRSEPGAGPSGEERPAPDETARSTARGGSESRAGAPPRGAVPGRPGVARVILAIDIEGFASRSRTDADRRHVRETLHRLLDEAFSASRLPTSDLHREDRGDGALIVVPPTVPAGDVLGAALVHLPKALRAHNRTAEEAVRVRLRAGLHVGPVHRDVQGVSGESVGTAFRLLDAPAVRRRAAETAADLTFVASDSAYETVIKPPSRSGDMGGYVRVEDRVRGSQVTGWLRLAAPPAEETPSATEGCAEILAMVDLYLDGELDGAAETAVRAHLEGCADCPGEYGLYQALKLKVARAGGGDLAPAALRDRIRSVLENLGEEAEARSGGETGAS